MNSFNYFDEIYCINLDKRTSRWELAQNEFKKLGILDRVKRFSAIDNLGGKRGCFESHMKIIHMAKENNLKNVFIFEDDVYFKNYDQSKLMNALNCLETEDWNLFFLGGNIINQDIDNKIEKKSDDLYQVNLPIYAIHAYAVNQSAYNRILRNHYLKIDWEKQDIISHHKRVWSMDKYLGDKIDKKHIMRNPMCFQKEGYSNINREVIEQTKISIKSYEDLFK